MWLCVGLGGSVNVAVCLSNLPTKFGLKFGNCVV